MNFFGNLLHIRCLLLFFAIGLMTTTLSAQAVSQNVNEPQETGKTQDKNETTDKALRAARRDEVVSNRT